MSTPRLGRQLPDLPSDIVEEIFYKVPTCEGRIALCDSELFTGIEHFCDQQRHRDLCHQEVVQVACGYAFTLFLRGDGSIACWGDDTHGQAPPAGVDGKFVAIAAGYDHSAAIRVDGTVMFLGSNAAGQAPPVGLLLT